MKQSHCCWVAAPNRSRTDAGTSDGASTRSVKAVSSQAIPGGPVAPGPVPATTFHLDPDVTLTRRGLDYLRPRNRIPSWRQAGDRRSRSWKAPLRHWCSDRAWRPPPQRCGCSSSRIRYWWCRRTVTTSCGRMQQNILCPLGLRCGKCAARICMARPRRPTWCSLKRPANPGLDVVDLHRLALDLSVDG